MSDFQKENSRDKLTNSEAFPGIMSGYDYLIVGAGLYGAVFAHEAIRAGKKCLVIDRRNHISGNAHIEKRAGIFVHQYGPHIFHTSNERVWEYVNRFVHFYPFVNAPLANYHGEIYNLPFNMNTFYQVLGTATPREAREKIREEIAGLGIYEPRNLEEQALQMVGVSLYEKLIRGYTQKQWGRPCAQLPASVIRRIPLRFTYDNRYFDDPYQGVPAEGYDCLVEKLLEGADVLLCTDYQDYIIKHPAAAEKTVYTGRIDEYYGGSEGVLEYRSLRFEHEEIAQPDYQGNAVVNFTAEDVPYTRIIEHKYFTGGKQPNTVITREYPQEWKEGMEPFYPVRDMKNMKVYQRYIKKAKRETDVIFGGRLGEFRYCNMDEVILSALQTAERELYG